MVQSPRKKPFFSPHRSDSDKRNIYQCHTFFMPRCTCASCCHFEQASGFPKLLAARTIRRHLAKQKLVARSIDSALSIVNTPVLSPVNSPFLASEPLSDSLLELDLEHDNAQASVDVEHGRAHVPRGRPRMCIEFDNRPLGSLLLDMRDKFPNMTEHVLNSQFSLHNANKQLGVDVDITGLQARRMQDRTATAMFEVFWLCHNQCSIQYGELRDEVLCPKCGALYDGGRVYLFDMHRKIFDLLRSHSFPEIHPPPESSVTRSFTDSPRCREVLASMPGPPNYRVLVSASFDGAVPWKRASRVDLWPLLLRIWNIPGEHRNKRENLVVALLVDVHPKNCNVVLEPIMDVFRMWWDKGVWVDGLERRAFIGNTIFHADLKGQASCLRLEGPFFFLCLGGVLLASRRMLPLLLHLVVGPCEGCITLVMDGLVACPTVELTSLRGRTLPSGLLFGAPRMSLFLGKFQVL